MAVLYLESQSSPFGVDASKLGSDVINICLSKNSAVASSLDWLDIAGLDNIFDAVNGRANTSGNLADS